MTFQLHAIHKYNLPYSQLQFETQSVSNSQYWMEIRIAECHFSRRKKIYDDVPDGVNHSWHDVPYFEKFSRSHYGRRLALF